MPGGIVEIEQQVFEILNWLPPDKGVYNCPEKERREYPQSPFFEEFTGAVVKRELKIGRCEHEQGHGGAGERVENCHPDGIGPGEDKGTLASQVKGLAAVGEHNHEEGGNPQPVKPYLSLVVHMWQKYSFLRIFANWK
jgi:hypothetical protein